MHGQRAIAAADDTGRRRAGGLSGAGPGVAASLALVAQGTVQHAGAEDKTRAAPRQANSRSARPPAVRLKCLLLPIR